MSVSIRRWAAAGRGSTRRRLPALLLIVVVGCSGEEPAEPVTVVPLYPGAELRLEETEFQRELLGILIEPGRPVPPTAIYETTASFPSVVAFYEDVVHPDSVQGRRFAVASRMRQLAAGIRTGGAQQVRVGRLLFARGDADTVTQAAMADSLEAVAERLGAVEGAIAFARISLAGQPGGQALVTIERPHLDPTRLTVDSLTVITVAGGPVAGQPPATGADDPGLGGAGGPAVGEPGSSGDAPAAPSPDPAAPSPSGS